MTYKTCLLKAFRMLLRHKQPELNKRITEGHIFFYFFVSCCLLFECLLVGRRGEVWRMCCFAFCDVFRVRPLCTCVHKVNRCCLGGSSHVCVQKVLFCFLLCRIPCMAVMYVSVCTKWIAALHIGACVTPVILFCVVFVSIQPPLPLWVNQRADCCDTFVFSLDVRWCECRLS